MADDILFGIAYSNYDWYYTQLMNRIEYYYIVVVKKIEVLGFNLVRWTYQEYKKSHLYNIYHANYIHVTSRFIWKN